MSALSLRPLALLVALLVAPARADVIVVDPAGGPGGALLQAAINAASSGDILLLRPGDYTDLETTVSGKHLALVADPPGAQVTLRRLSLSLPQAPGETTLLRGLTVAAPALTTEAETSGITMQGPIGNASGAWLEDCTTNASVQDVDGPGGLPPHAGAGMTLLISAPCVVVRCTVSGADGFDAVPGELATGGGAGLQTFLSIVAIHEGAFTGGAGGDGDPGPLLSHGGPGISSVGFVSVMGATLRGGDEGADNPATMQPGAGLSVEGFGYARGIDAQPGDVVGAGTPNLPVVVKPGGNFTNFSASPRSLSVASPLREGELGTLALHGETGDGVWLYIGLGGGMKHLVSKQGAFLLAELLPSPVFLGPITDPSGALDIGFHMPDLPTGIDGSVIYLQSIMSPAGGGLVTGSGSALLWLDAAL